MADHDGVVVRGSDSYLEQIEKQYFLEKGSYRITFYTRQDVMVCFSVVAIDKTRIRIENNVLVSYEYGREPVIYYKFKLISFLKLYFKHVNEFYEFDVLDKVKIMMEALNEIYLDQAKIPTQLL